MTQFYTQRLRQLNSTELNLSNGKAVIYLMSRDQRLDYNFALLVAAQAADHHHLPLVVVFNLYPDLRSRAYQHFMFMLQGLQELEQSLNNLNIGFKVFFGDFEKNLKKINQEFAPAEVYLDFSPLNKSKKQQKQAAKFFACPVTLVDTHNIIPVWQASDKQEYNAYFLRRKIHRQLDQYLQPYPKLKKIKQKWPKKIINDWSKLKKQVKAEKLTDYLLEFKPGEKAAHQILAEFLQKKLLDYAEKRNDPNQDVLSNLSPYLHFGQISSLEVTLAVKDYVKKKKAQFGEKKLKKLQQSQESFLEELIVRKELADNYCFYNDNYDSLAGLPAWSVKTLTDHEQDLREYIYQRQQLEKAETHDDAWNAAQIEMAKTGKMHGYMRMYWAKKILEWSPNAATAIKRAIYLNDKYSVDGYDPNGYAGILWSIGGLHDRPWPERKIFGKVRYMSFDGLKRKFDIKKYIGKFT